MFNGLAKRTSTITDVKAVVASLQNKGYILYDMGDIMFGWKIFNPQTKQSIVAKSVDELNRLAISLPEIKTNTDTEKIGSEEAVMNETWSVDEIEGYLKKGLIVSNKMCEDGKKLSKNVIKSFGNPVEKESAGNALNAHDRICSQCHSACMDTLDRRY